MRFACPQCSHACGLFKGVCPSCGLSLTLGSVLRFYGQQMKAFLSRTTALRCPHCGAANPVKASTCVNCQTDLTVRVAMESVLSTPRQRWHNFLRSIDAPTRRRIQWVYLIFSAALLWWLLGYFEKHGSSLFLSMALSVIFVAVLAFFALWLIPRRIFRSVFLGASRIVKLALAFNGLALTMGVQLWIHVWWARALTLAGLFVIIWLGAWCLHRLILPMTNETAAVFLGNDSRDFDTEADQGRTAKWD